MTGTVSSRDKEEMSTPCIQQALHMCFPDPLKEKDFGKDVCEHRAHRQHSINAHRSHRKKRSLGEGD